MKMTWGGLNRRTPTGVVKEIKNAEWRMQNGEQGDNDKAGGDCGRGGPAFAEATAGRPAFAWLPPPPKRFGVTSRRGQRAGLSGLKRALGTAGPTAAIRHPDSACLVLITQERIAFKYGLSTEK